MKNFILIYLALSLTWVHAQGEEKPFDHVTSTFISAYNTANYSGIYDMLDPIMQQLTTAASFAETLNTVRSNFGALKKMEFTGSVYNAYQFRNTYQHGVANMYIGIDHSGKISSLFIPRNEEENASIPERNTTPMIFPFKEEAFVYWGGETLEQNYHMEDPNQQFAYDILMVANGAPYAGDPTKNESYLIFGKEIMAPCDATVVKVIDGVADNIPGEVNTHMLTGNTIVLKTAPSEYVLMAHLKNNSIRVQEGDQVKKGQLIAQCGNSGNTTQAHLHLQSQNTPDLFNTLGVKLYFEEIMVNGQLKNDHMPVKEDFVKNKKPY